MNRWETTDTQYLHQGDFDASCLEQLATLALGDRFQVGVARSGSTEDRFYVTLRHREGGSVSFPITMSWSTAVMRDAVAYVMAVAAPLGRPRHDPATVAA